VLVDQISNARANQALIRPSNDTHHTSAPKSLKPPIYGYKRGWPSYFIIVCRKKYVSVRERIVTASPVMTKSRAPGMGNNYPENGLVKPPRRDTRALSPSSILGGKALLRLAAQKSRVHAPSVLIRSAFAYFLCK
jgi:hypothetical protein